MQKYIVVEIQTNSDGTVATITNAYDDFGTAQQRYHAILSAAAVSSLPIHSAVILTPNGVATEFKGYDRTQGQ